MDMRVADKCGAGGCVVQHKGAVAADVTQLQAGGVLKGELPVTQNGLGGLHIDIAQRGIGIVCQSAGCQHIAVRAGGFAVQRSGTCHAQLLTGFEPERTGEVALNLKCFRDCGAQNQLTEAVHRFEGSQAIRIQGQLCPIAQIDGAAEGIVICLALTQFQVIERTGHHQAGAVLQHQTAILNIQGGGAFDHRITGELQAVLPLDPLACTYGKGGIIPHNQAVILIG